MKNYILIFLLAILPISAFSQSDYSFGNWNASIASMPSARSTFSAVSYHDSIYVLGGFINLAAPENVSSVDVYVPASDTWITGITEFPFARGCPNACLIGDKIYAFGGSRITGGGADFTAYDSLHIYDIKTNTWERGQCLPAALSYFAADTLNGKIYLAGGGGTGYTISSSLYVYDPELDEWTEKAPMSTSRWGNCARSWNGKLYVFGGYTGAGWSISRSLEVYDPETDEWTQLSNSSIQRTSMVMFLLEGQLFVMGGYQSSNTVQTRIISRYDIASDTWFNFFHEGDNMPEGRRFSAGTVLDKKLYFFGGGASDIMDNAWSYSLKSIQQVKALEDTVIDAEDIVIDLAGYFSSTLDEDLTYSICPGYDETAVSPSLDSCILTIQSLAEAGEGVELTVNVFNSLDTISSNTFTLNKPILGLEHSSKGLLNVYPNPASDVAFIRYSLPQSEVVTLEIYNTQGQVVKQFRPDNSTMTNPEFAWTLEDMHNGFYFVVLKTRSTTSVSKLLIQHE